MKSPNRGLLHASTPCVGVQVVHDITATEDENALFAERCKALANVVVKRGRLCLVDAQLNHGNVGQRIEVAQYRPSTMIQPPTLIAPDRQRRQKFLHTSR